MSHVKTELINRIIDSIKKRNIITLNAQKYNDFRKKTYNYFISLLICIVCYYMNNREIYNYLANIHYFNHIFSLKCVFIHFRQKTS